jgi:hypothetical protein
MVMSLATRFPRLAAEVIGVSQRFRRYDRAVIRERLVRLALLATAAALLGSSSAVAHVAANPTVLADCLGKPVVKPDEIVLACGDGNESVGDLTWTGWGSRFTAGRGIVQINDCSPSCVAGHDHSYPVVVLLTGRETCRPSGKIAYRTLTIAFLDHKPHTTGTQTFPCHPFG